MLRCVWQSKRLFRGICSSVLGRAAAVRAVSQSPWPSLIAAPFLPTQLLFVLLLLAGQDRDAAVHDWVGDLSLGAKWMTKMKAENTIHCLGPEMPALFHVELLPYRYNPFPAAHGFQPGSLPLHSGRCLRNSCPGIPDKVSFAPGKGRSSGVTVVQCHSTSSLCRGANLPRAGSFHLCLWLNLWG